MVEMLSDKSFEAEVKDYAGYVLIDFWAPWCGPCRQLSPIIDELYNELKGRVKVCKMNIDENINTPSQLGVRSIPALMLFKDGKLISNKVGSLPKKDLLTWVESEIS